MTGGGPHLSPFAKLRKLHLPLGLGALPAVVVCSQSPQLLLALLFGNHQPQRSLIEVWWTDAAWPQQRAQSKQTLALKSTQSGSTSCISGFCEMHAQSSIMKESVAATLPTVSPCMRRGRLPTSLGGTQNHSCPSGTRSLRLPASTMLRGSSSEQDTDRATVSRLFEE